MINRKAFCSKTAELGKAAPVGGALDTWIAATDRRFVWLPNVEDYVEATFINLRSVEEDGEVRRVLDLDLLKHNLTMEQARNVNCCMYCKGTLYRRLCNLGLKAGEIIKIVYNGKKPVKSAYGNIEMHDFSVFVKRG
jgi:hypothetical protein